MNELWQLLIVGSVVQRYNSFLRTNDFEVPWSGKVCVYYKLTFVGLYIFKRFVLFSSHRSPIFVILEPASV